MTMLTREVDANGVAINPSAARLAADNSITYSVGYSLNAH